MENVEGRDALVGPRRPGGRTARTREAVIEAASGLLSELGPAELTVSMIAERAKVNPTTIYRKWGTKDALLAEVLLSLSGIRLSMPNTGSLRQDLVGALSAVLDFLQTPEGFGLVRFGAVSETPESLALREVFWGDRLAKAREIFERAEARGEAVDVEAGVLAYEAMIATLHFRLLERRASLERELPERLVDLMLLGVLRA